MFLSLSPISLPSPLCGNQWKEYLQVRIFLKGDVDEAYMSNAELEALLEGLADQIHFYRQL